MFETLQIHRNKKAHRTSEVTVASLCALCGTVLTVLELASYGWIDQESVDSLRRSAKDGLEEVAQQVLGDMNYGDQIDRDETDKLHEESKEIRGKLKESRGASQTASEIYDGLQDFQEEIMKVIDGKMEVIHDALTALRDEMMTDSSHHHPVEEDEEPGNEMIDGTVKKRPLTREMARQKLGEGSKRITDKLGIDYRANIFQSWIVKAALEKAVTDGLNRIDDWWALPIVQDKKREYEKEMQQQLQLIGCEDWMMDIYRRVEKRSNSRA